jgi:hypothetical protein
MMLSRHLLTGFGVALFGSVKAGTVAVGDPAVAVIHRRNPLHDALPDATCPTHW